MRKQGIGRQTVHLGLTGVALALGACHAVTAQPALLAHKPAAIAATQAPVLPTQLPVLPTHVHLPMPASLQAVMGGDKVASLMVGGNIMVNNGGNLISQGGGNVIAQGGGNVIAQGGGNVIAQGRGNYRLAACARPQVTGQSYFYDIMGLVLTPYAESVLIVNGVLQRALAGGITLDTPKTIDDPRGGTGKLSLLLSNSATGAVLRVADGAEFHDANQILAVAFASQMRGVAVYRSLALHPTLGHLALSIRFDLVAGRIVADGLADPTVLPAATSSSIYRAHWEFDAPAQPAPNAPAFTMHLASFSSNAADVCDTGARGVTAKFLANGQGVVRMGRVIPGATKLAFTRNDGKGYDDIASAADDFFMGSNGKQMLTGAPAALLALAPGAEEFLGNFPPDPAVGQAFADPTFAFPDGKTVLTP
jgi:hypothetical protein